MIAKDTEHPRTPKREKHWWTRSLTIPDHNQREQIQNDRMVRNALEDLNKPDKAQTAAVILLQWLAQVAQAAT